MLISDYFVFYSDSDIETLDNTNLDSLTCLALVLW